MPAIANSFENMDKNYTLAWCPRFASVLWTPGASDLSRWTKRVAPLLAFFARGGCRVDHNAGRPTLKIGQHFTIKLRPGVCATSWERWVPAGLDRIWGLAARLKPCPFTNPGDMAHLFSAPPTQKPGRAENGGPPIFLPASAAMEPAAD
jgi:hypothetical protein